MDNPGLLVQAGVTRVEVVDEHGRVYTRRQLEEVTLSYQDDGKTLKIFVSGVLDENGD